MAASAPCRSRAPNRPSYCRLSLPPSLPSLTQPPGVSVPRNSRATANARGNLPGVLYDQPGARTAAPDRGSRRAGGFLSVSRHARARSLSARDPRRRFYSFMPSRVAPLPLPSPRVPSFPRHGARQRPCVAPSARRYSFKVASERDLVDGARWRKVAGSRAASPHHQASYSVRVCPG